MLPTHSSKPGRTLCSLRAALALRKGRRTTIMVDSMALGRTSTMYLTCASLAETQSSADYLSSICRSS